MAIKGLKEIQEKTAEAVDLASQNRAKYLYLGDGDSAMFRFIDDEEIVQAKIHEYKEMTPMGENHKKTYCSESLTGTPCKWCASGNIAKGVYIFLVYVYHIVHKNQNPKLNTDSNATKWEVVKQGAQTFYKEDVNEIRTLRIKFGKDSYLKNAILQFAGEYTTLCDRDYRFTRTGAGLKTLYSFVPKDPSKVSQKVLDAKKEAVSLVDSLLKRKTEPVEKVAEVEQAEEIPVEVLEDETNEKVVAKAKPGRPKKEAAKEEKLTKEVEDLF
jgi:hypothetical protein